MHKLKYLFFILILIIISFLLSALSPPPKTSQYNFDLSTSIPAKHKIKIINYGNGSLFVDDERKNNGDIIVCPRFSNLDVKAIPDSNYEIDKIFFDDEDITSILDSDTIIIHNITKDGTLKFKFKASVKAADPSLKDLILKTRDILTNKAINTRDFLNNKTFEMKSYLTDKASDTVDSLSSVMKTGDFSFLSIFIIFILIISPLIYILYYIRKH